MNMKLTGVAFGAVMIGLIGAGTAKADAIAVADIDVTNAFFSTDSAGTTPVDFTNILKSVTGKSTLQSVAGLGVDGDNENVTNGPSFGSPATNYNSVASSNKGSLVSSTSQSAGGSTSSASSSLIGSLLTAAPGGTGTSAPVTATTSADLNLANGYFGASNSAKNIDTSTVSFTASASTPLYLNFNLSYTLFADLFNSNNDAQSADASVTLSFDFRDTSPGGADLFASVLNLTANTIGASGSAGQADAISRAVQVAFDIKAGDSYTLNISQVSTADAFAVPEPGTLALFGAGLAGLGLFGFRRKKTGGLAA
jgi:hypothetical protein